MNTIEAIDVSKKFGKLKVLEKCNYKFESSKIYVLYGKNGSGKSVFLKILSGLYLCTSGKILYNGKQVKDSLDFPFELRAFIEKPSFISYLTGFENLLLLSKIKHLVSETEINKALKTVNLYDFRDKVYKEYSFGMKQKLAIAATIMEDPSVIILDEPFNGIDSESSKKIRNYLVNEKKKGKLIIIATHLEEDIKSISDEVYTFEII